MFQSQCFSAPVFRLIYVLWHSCFVKLFIYYSYICCLLFLLISPVQKEYLIKKIIILYRFSSKNKCHVEITAISRQVELKLSNLQHHCHITFFRKYFHSRSLYQVIWEAYPGSSTESYIIIVSQNQTKLNSDFNLYFGRTSWK